MASLQNVGSLMQVFLILIVVGYVVILTGNGIQNTAENEIYADADNIVSCKKNKLEHLKAEHVSLENGFNTRLSGYCTITVSVFFIVLITLFNKCFKRDHNENLLCDSWINCSFPAICTLIVLLYKLSLNFTYADRLKLDKVANEYYYYSNIAGFLIFFQIVFLIKYIFDKFVICDKKNINSRLSLLIYILSIINLLLLGITNVIVKFFSTDG